MGIRSDTYDFVVVGAGSAGCAVAAGLIEAGVGSVLIIEAGPSDKGWLVKAPLGVAWLMGSRRDWRFTSAPQTALDGRRVRMPRGKLLGGSSSINSMVWFRGRRDDFDHWRVEGWSWQDVEPAFEAVEARLTPSRLAYPHPLTEGLQSLFRRNDVSQPTPEYESAGVFLYNLRDGKRWSAADAFLRPAVAHGLHVLTGQQVEKLELRDGTAHAVVFRDGSKVVARHGIVLSAGSIGSPEILLRSGIGPAGDLAAAGIETLVASEEVGHNLHDHPAVGIHFAGTHAGYGLTARQIPAWIAAPWRYLSGRSGPIASPTVEGGAFFNARDDGGPPDMQMHFIPFMMGWKDSLIVTGSGYFADVCISRPRSRGQLKLSKTGIEIDLRLLTDPDDFELMVAGFKRLRALLKEARFGDLRAPEAFPGEDTVESDDEISDHVRATAATTFHPVGTLRMGTGSAPVTPRLRMRGVDNLWVADASIMPQVTSANTNAPSMMIDYRAARMIAEDVHLERSGN